MAAPTDTGKSSNGQRDPEADSDHRTAAANGLTVDGPPLPEQLAEDAGPQGTAPAAGSPDAPQPDVGNAVSVERPAPGLEVAVPVVPGQPLRLDFNIDEISGRQLDGDNLVLEFPDGARVILVDYLIAFGLAGELPTEIVEADGDLIALSELLAPAAGPGAGGPGTGAGGLGFNSPFDPGDIGPGLNHLDRLGNEDLIFSVPEPDEEVDTDILAARDDGGDGPPIDDDPAIEARDDMDMTEEGSVTSGNVVTGADPDADPINQGVLQADEVEAGGPLLRSISHDGVTYTLNAARDGVGASDGSTAHSYDDATGILTVSTALGGIIAIDMNGADPGSYTYTAPPEAAHIDALLGVPFDDPQLGVSKSLGQWLDLFDDGNTTLQAFDVTGAAATFGKKNVSFTLNGLEHNYAGIGVVGSGGRDTETDFVEGQGAEHIEVGFDAPLQPGAMVGVGALFDGTQPGVPFDGDNLEQLAWEAWLGGSMVSSGTVDGTANGLASFTVDTAFDRLVLRPLQISPGSDEGGFESDFLLQYIHGAHLDNLEERFGYVLEDTALQQDDAILTIEVKDAVPGAADDNEMLTEGQSISDTVLANDTIGADVTGAGIRELVHGGVTYTLANADPSGVVTIDTLLGGELRINLLTGEYTYDAAPSLDHSGGPLFEGFSYVLMDGDWDTDSATLTIEVKDGVPVARDDNDMVEAGGQQTAGNVITGVDGDPPPADGMLVADDEGPDGPNAIREIDHNGVTYTLSDDVLSVVASDGSTDHGYNPLTGELTVDTALGGTLTIDLTGADRGLYTYTSPPSLDGLPGGVFEVGPGSIPSFVDIVPDDGAGGPATVFTDPTTGFGVVSANDDGNGRRFNEINQNNDGTRESLTFDFNGVDASEAQIDLSKFFAREGSVGNERGRWQAFNGGVLVGEADFEATSTSGNFSFTISGIGRFDTLVFTALPGSAGPTGGDNSDYFVKGMAVTLADGASETFGYTLEDTDGSQDSATLVIDIKENDAGERGQPPIALALDVPPVPDDGDIAQYPRGADLYGNDRLEGGSGDDVIAGGEGHDRIYGKNGDDQLIGEAGNDYLSGGNGNDILVGGAGHDTLEAGNGDDRLFGGAGNDTLRGGNGDDLLDGGGGRDTLDGGRGDDKLQMPDMNVAKVDGGRGTDTLRFAEAVDIDFATVDDAKIENVEIIDLHNEAADSLELGLQDVLDITDSGTELTIMGDSADRVEADFSGHTVEVTTGAELTTYVIGGGAATVNIDNDIEQDVSGNIV